MTTSPYPKEVTKQARQAEEATGIPASIEATGPASWRVVVASETVEASAEFASYLGKTRYTGGKLLVGGIERPRVRLDELAAVFEEAAGTTRPVMLAEIPQGPGQPDMPGPVRDAVTQFTRNIPALADTVAAGWDGGRWIVGVTVPDGSGIRLFFTRQRGGHWSLDRREPLQVIAGGQDLTAEAAGDVSKALTLLAGATPPGQEAPRPGGGPASPAAPGGANSVRVRKQTVIRN